jgi:hypothetical protein
MLAKGVTYVKIKIKKIEPIKATGGISPNQS